MEQLYPYQAEGADFLSGMTRGFLFDEMGLGKSAQAIRAADKIGAEKILVLCPAAARINWGREFDKFSTGARSREIVLNSTQQLSRATAGITIVPYDLVHKKAIWNQLYIGQWDVIVLDEAHFLKEPEAQRTQALYGPNCTGELGLVEKGFMVWPLTGTPIPNNPLELWPALRALVPEAITRNGKPLSWWDFLNRYCVYTENRWGRVRVKKGKNLQELRQLIKPYTLRRKKKDVLTDLPPMRITQVALDVPDAYKIFAQLEDLLDVQRLQRVIDSGDELGDINLEDFLHSNHLATLRRVVGIAKAHAIVQLLEQEFACGLEKIVIMAWHNDVMDILREGLRAAGINVVQLRGDTPVRQRQEAIDRFQTDPACQVFIGQIQAAGTAITLTAASQLLFAEMSWSPSDNEQAAMRVHRIGQKDSVLVRCAYLPDSIDEAVTAVLRRKMTTINELIN